MDRKAPRFLLIVALLGVGGATLYVGYRFTNPDAELVGFERWVACEACGEVYRGVLESRPAKCSKCGKEALWPAGRCGDCGHQFPVNIQKLRQVSPEIRCPKCNSKEIEEIPDPSPS